MIAVIADDLTGAAELGGIGLTKGLKVEISFAVNPDCQADLLVVATDTRSGSESKAVAEISEITRQVANLKPEIIFKKTDSVLRGHVVSELEAQLSVLNLDSALLVPANPQLGRTIEYGTYFIHDVPIAQTSFAHDPEFPAKYSDILSLLGSVKGNVQVEKYNNTALKKGITVAEVKEIADLEYWTRYHTDKVLLAGGSGFFKALLDKIIPVVAFKPRDLPLSKTMLYVCGSAHQYSVNLLKSVAATGEAVSYMPQALCDAPDNTALLTNWRDEILNLIAERQKAVIAIEPGSGSTLSASELRNVVARLVKQVFDKQPVSELLIEGGSTASAVFRALHIETLYPVNEYATGVIRSQVNGFDKLYVTLKPGSYAWPSHIWQF